MGALVKAAAVRSHLAGSPSMQVDVLAWSAGRGPTGETEHTWPLVRRGRAKSVLGLERACVLRGLSWL